MKNEKRLFIEGLNFVHENLDDSESDFIFLTAAGIVSGRMSKEIDFKGGTVEQFREKMLESFRRDESLNYRDLAIGFSKIQENDMGAINDSDSNLIHLNDAKLITFNGDANHLAEITIFLDNVIGVSRGTISMNRNE